MVKAIIVTNEDPGMIKVSDEFRDDGEIVDIIVKLKKKRHRK